jgi:hypothetical protein
VKRPNYNPLFRPSKRMKIILTKLRERSTWAGVAVLVGAFGLPIPPGVVEYAGEAIGAIAGILLILKSDKPKTKA